MLVALGSPAFAAGDVRVTMHDGFVSISAHGATLGEILSAWAQAGRTQIVNVDQIPTAPPLTLELTNAREEEALAILLRSMSGYLTIARTNAAPELSRFDRIVLAPSSVANHDSSVSNAAASPMPSPQAPPQRQQSVIINGIARLIGPGGVLVEDDQQDAPPAPPRGVNRGDAPPTPVQPPTPVPVVGSSTPGLIPPQPPGAPGAPGAQPATPQR